MTHTTILRPFYRDHQGEPVPEEIFWTFMVQRKITKADTLTIRLGATPSGLISGFRHPPIFTPDALPATTIPLYPGLLTWDRYQICWLAYSVAWFTANK